MEHNDIMRPGHVRGPGRASCGGLVRTNAWSTSVRDSEAETNEPLPMLIR